MSSDEWFVVNVADAPWLSNDKFGDACVFETERFPQVGYTLHVLQPGQPNGMYHRESNQEDFLVLQGECLLLVAGEERRMRAWDFFHCPPGTEHIFVGAGDGPCVIFMAGARTNPRDTVYTRSDAALRHDAGVETETAESSEAYAPFPKWARAQRAPWSPNDAGRG